MYLRSVSGVNNISRMPIRLLSKISGATLGPKLRALPNHTHHAVTGPLLSSKPSTYIHCRMYSTPDSSNNDSNNDPSNNNPSNTDSSQQNIATAKITPEYMIAFTCKKCDTRSSHTFSKQAYHHGTVAVQCPGCKNRHLIADHLKIFKDNKVTIEDLLKEKGESVNLNVGDLVFDDIPEKLKSTLGRYAKDAPAEYHKEDAHTGELPEGKEVK